MIMKILLLISFIIYGLHGQDPSSTKNTTTLSVLVKVTSRLEMTTLRDINIGIVQPSQIQVNLDPGKDQGAGLLKISGGRFLSVKLAYTQQVEMVNSITGGILLVNYSLSGSPANDQNSSIPISDNPIVLALGEKGDYYVWVGCSFSLLSIESGNYDGSFEIEIDYF